MGLITQKSLYDIRTLAKKDLEVHSDSEASENADEERKYMEIENMILNRFDS